VVLAVTNIYPFQFFPKTKNSKFMRRALVALSSQLPIRDVTTLEDKVFNEEISVHTKKSNIIFQSIYVSLLLHFVLLMDRISLLSAETV
jgi:hypothetical protein